VKSGACFIVRAVVIILCNREDVIVSLCMCVYGDYEMEGCSRGGGYCIYRDSGASNNKESREEKSVDRRSWRVMEKTDGFRRLSCLQLSQRPPGVLTRPRQPRGWLTHEYIFVGSVVNRKTKDETRFQ